MMQQGLSLPLCVLAITTLIAGSAFSDEPKDKQSDRNRRIELINGFAARHRIASTDKPDAGFPLRPQALMYWTNPTRGDASGGIFLWVRDIRPVACGGVFLWFGQPTEIAREFHSLTDEPITAMYGDERIWAPNRPGVKFQVIPESSPAAVSASRRLRQIKEFASDFSVSISNGGTPPRVLRQLPTPLYRYSDPKSGVIDGAIMAFVQGTDPEALLVIEARSDVSTTHWNYAFARCTAWAVTARLDDNVVYEVPFYDFNTTDASAPFYNVGRKPLD